MKRILHFLLVTALAAGTLAWAGGGKDKKDKPATSAKPAAEATTVNGWIGDDKCGAKGAQNAACTKKCIEGGAKAILVNDADGSVWAIDNPDAIRGHEGHHVTVTGHLDADKKSIHIASLKMMEGKSEPKPKS